MQKLYLLLAALSALAPLASAQNPYEPAFDHAFADLDLSQTATGVLAQRGAYVLDPLPYDGTQGAPALTGDAWSVLYWQVTESYAGVPTIPAVTQIRASAQAVAAQGHVPIAVLWQPMDQLIEEDPSTGERLLELDGQDGQVFRPPFPGTARGAGAYAAPPPFKRIELFAAAALTSFVRDPESASTFVLDPGLFVVADGSSVGSVEIDLGNGWQPVALGQPITASGSGPVTARVRAQIGGATRHAAFELDLSASARLGGGEIPNITSGNDVSNPFEYTLGRRSFQATTAPSSFYTGDYAASYRWAAYLRSEHDGVIRNPVIIVDGFDTADYWPNWNGIYDESEAITTEKLYAQLDQEADGQPGLASALRAQGYDVVVVDYRDSQDFIQRNGLAVADAIEDIQNLMPADSTVAAVIGLSMGGLTSRYALLTLEADGGHRVDRYISFDSPHQGANVPIAFQFAIDRIDFIPEVAPLGFGNPIGYFRALFDTPAFRQLVYYNFETETTDPARADLYDWFDGRYPTQTRLNAAIANGGSAVAQRTSPQGTFAGQFGPEFEMVSFLFGVKVDFDGVPFEVGVEYDVDLMSAPARSNVSKPVFKSEPRICLPILGCAEIPIGGFFNNVRLANGYDSAPGSWRPTTGFPTLVPGGTPVPGGALLSAPHGPHIGIGDIRGFSLKFETLTALHTFIPTLSALDYEPPGTSRPSLQNNLFNNQDLYYNVLADVQNGQNTWKSRTPFDEIYFAGHPRYGDPNDNFDHVLNPQPGVIAFLFEQLANSGPVRYESQTLADGHRFTTDSDLHGTITQVGSNVYVEEGVTVRLFGNYTAGTGSTLRVNGTLVLHNGSSLDAKVNASGTGSQVVIPSGVTVQLLKDLTASNGATVANRGGTLVVGGGVTVELAPSAAPFATEPGSVFALGQGADVTLGVPAQIVGTPAAPVRFERSSQGARWGTLHVRGDGSTLRHVVLDGGTANVMVAADHVTVDRVTSRNGGRNLQTVYETDGSDSHGLRITDSLFEDATYYGLDLYFTHASVENAVVRRSG